MVKYNYHLPLYNGMDKTISSQESHVNDEAMSTSESLAMTIGGGFFGGILVGYAMKKVIKIAAVVVGLFLVSLAYLQHLQIIAINWNNLQTVSQNVLIVISNHKPYSNWWDTWSYYSFWNVGLRYSINWKYVHGFCCWFCQL